MNPEKIKFDPTHPVVNGPLELDFKNNSCRLPDGKVAKLSNRMMQLASMLSPYEYIKREQLENMLNAHDAAVAGFDLSDTPPEWSNFVPVYIRYLRSRLGRSVIDTRWKEGYKLLWPEEPIELS